MIKAIIFDCFGVVLIDAFDAAYQGFGGDIVADQEFIIQTLYASNSGRIPSSSEVFANRLCVPVEMWRKAINEGSAIQQDVLDYVLLLRKDYKTAMLSNIAKGGLGRMFEPGVLDTYFDAVVASGDIGFAKPEARAYETVADMLDVRLDECVFIDDREIYVEGANAVGMKGVIFTSLKQLKQDLSGILAA